MTIKTSIGRKLTTGVVLAAAMVLMSSTLFLQGAVAATGSMYFSPSTVSVTQGSDVSLALRIDPGAAINTVTATISFDTSKLTFVSLNYSGSPFTTQAPGATTSSSVNFVATKMAGTVSTDSLVATITLQAVAGSGSSTVTLDGNAAIPDPTGGSNATATNPSTSNATVNFTSAPTVCPDGQTGTPPNCTTPPTGGGSGSGGSSGGSSSGSSSGSSKSGGSSSKSSSGSKSSSSTSTDGASTTAAPPSVAGTTIGYTLAKITATSKSPTQMYVRYGLNKSSLDIQTPLTGYGTSHQLTLDPNSIVPGQTYYYVVYAKDKQGVTSKSSVQSFVTKGLTVSIGAFDRNHNPIKGKEITLHSATQTAKTDKSGFATFTNVAPGLHHVSYTDGSKTYDEPIQVANNIVTTGDTQTAPTQSLSVVYPFEQKVAWWMSRTVISAAIIVVLIIAIILFVRYHRRMPFSGFKGGFPNAPEAIVVGGNGSTHPVADNKPDETTERLNSIPGPTSLQPGNTITPHDDKEGEE